MPETIYENYLNFLQISRTPAVIQKNSLTIRKEKIMSNGIYSLEGGLGFLVGLSLSCNTKLLLLISTVRKTLQNSLLCKRKKKSNVNISIDGKIACISRCTDMHVLNQLTSIVMLLSVIISVGLCMISNFWRLAYVGYVNCQDLFHLYSICYYTKFYRFAYTDK